MAHKVFRVVRPFRRRAQYESREGWVTDWNSDVSLHDKTGVLFDTDDVLVIRNHDPNIVGKLYHHYKKGLLHESPTQAPRDEQMHDLLAQRYLRELT